MGNIIKLNGGKRDKKSRFEGAPEKKRRKGTSRAGIIAGAILGFLVLLFVVMGVSAKGSQKIYPGVTVNKIALGGKTLTEAVERLKASPIGAEGLTVTVQLPLGSDLVIKAGEAGLPSDAAELAGEAYQYGRRGGFIKNTLTYIKCVLGGTDLDFTDRLSEQAIRSIVAQKVEALNEELMSTDMVITDTAVEIVKGAKALTLDVTELTGAVTEGFKSGKSVVLDRTDMVKPDTEIDLSDIYDMVYMEPQDAVYDLDTKTILDQVNGRSFDLQTAQELWDSAPHGSTVVIPLVITEPEVTKAYLDSILFADLLAQKTTTLTREANRNNNVKKAAASVNELILNPGEEFSFNETVGQRTKEAGYLGAGAYSGGKVVTEVGGGICQVSSTLYYCALLSNLKISQRTCHWFAVSYLPQGLDATVSWPSPDFRFVNNRDYPIRIVTATDLDKYTMTVQVYGTDVDGSYVQMTTETWATANAFGATSYRWVYDKDGKLISKTKEADSLYHYHEEENPEASPSPSPSPPPSVSPEPTESPKPSETPPVTESPVPSESPKPSESPEPTPPAAGTPVA